ncbi:polysaccharide deacetylase [Caldicellulosiruptor kronotskyensis 2002]|uniref:Polysaccharide deacetylase n=1 Tax=Caldicellulosiruptor kronotskyensis (strain DSM 18902 / VKM B-2412 / 2002) TaxID=632348 RepID=E4SE18_CALK2|nr:polysaccharide deacetylase family protein [Caldicellulosiruptor kronotskyensis]ADQ45305.1 polysaccharide deacetylase [Caldicellulosiruptor kronotskyensis 2002]
MKVRFVSAFFAVILIYTLISSDLVFAQPQQIKIPVLVYHYFAKDQKEAQDYNSSTVVNIQKFERQMEYLYKNNFKTLTMEELYKFLKGEYTPPKKSVVITMDDGYKNNITLAYPILKKYRFRACIFVIGKFLISKNSSNEFEYLSFEDTLKYTDVFEFGSHTYDMHRLLNGMPILLQANMLDIIFDFVNNQMLINSPYFAYPFGAYDEKVIEVLKSFNYKLAFTTKKGYVTSSTDPYEIPRFTISQKTTFDQFVKIVNGEYFDVYVHKSSNKIRKSKQPTKLLDEKLQYNFIQKRG